MIKLRGNNFSKEEVYESLKEGKLMTITIFLENVCNFKCPFCLTQTRDFKNELTTEETKKIILEGKELGARTVMIAGAGEPLMASNFWEIIDFIDSLGLNIIVFSNLSLITQEVAKRLYEKKISIIAKVNSFKKEVQELYIGNISGAFEDMQSGLINLIGIGYNNLNSKNETMLCMETSILHENIDEIYDYWVFCRKNNIYPIIDTIYYQGKATEQDYDHYLVDYDKILNVLKRINEYDKSMGIYWNVKLLNRNNKGVLIGEVGIECVKIGTNLNIDVEGNVYDCFNMSGDGYGNIRTEALINIWKKHKPFNNAISVHGLCKCRNYVDREKILGEIECLA